MKEKIMITIIKVCLILIGLGYIIDILNHFKVYHI